MKTWVLIIGLMCGLTLRAAEKPNIVFIIADDISWNDLGCYGHPTIRTPNLDKLAANGMRFDNAYLTTSSCSPSRCSIITGRYPHNTGAPELHTALPEGQPLFPKILQDAGYYTVLSGKHHMGAYASTAFDKVSKGRGPGKEEDWVEILQNRPKDKPFFCWFASTDAHRSWQIDKTSPRYAEGDAVVPPYMVDGSETRQDLAKYYHEVSRLDHYVGKVIEELRNQQQLKNTLVIFCADNGRPFPRDKTRLYDSGIKTPFIISWPAQVKPSVTESLISSIDIAATCLEVAGVEKDIRIQGTSFLPILRNPNKTVRNIVFSEHNWHVYQNHERMVCKNGWVYIRNHYPEQANLCVEGVKFQAGEALWKAHAAGTLNKYQQQVVQDNSPAEELYRLSKDPHQLTNLAGNPEYTDILKMLRKQLDRWIEETGDSVADHPTPDRDARPGQQKPAHWKQVEMPGENRSAQQNNHPGAIIVKPAI